MRVLSGKFQAPLRALADVAITVISTQVSSTVMGLVKWFRLLVFRHLVPFLGWRVLLAHRTEVSFRELDHISKFTSSWVAWKIIATIPS